MLKPCLLLATLGLTVLATGCGPEERVTSASTITEPCAGTPEACAELERQKGLTEPPTQPCAGTPEACGILERQQGLADPPTQPCAGTPEACGILVPK